MKQMLKRACMGVVLLILTLTTLYVKASLLDQLRMYLRLNSSNGLICVNRWP